MRVDVDEQVFVRLRRGGISRYFVELLAALATAADGTDARLDAHWVVNDYAVEAGLARRFPSILGERRRMVTQANRLARRLSARDALCDVRHLTLYDPAYLPEPRTGTAAVVTVHDMIPELFPDEFRASNLHAGKKECVEHAQLVVCVSQSTKNDLLRLYGPVSAPVVVIPLGVSPRFRVGPGPRRPAWLPESYVLHVGERGGYKDFATTLQAFGQLAGTGSLHLVAVGGGPWTQAEAISIDRAGLADRVHQMSVADREMPVAYAGASCLVVPSRYEGFGLPVLEAMAAGCPVVCAAGSSLPEVGGAAARYFAPGDVDALADLLTTITSTAEVGLALREAGLARAAEFSWDVTAAATAAAYRTAIAAMTGQRAG